MFGFCVFVIFFFFGLWFCADFIISSYAVKPAAATTTSTTTTTTNNNNNIGHCTHTSEGANVREQKSQRRN